MAEAVTASAPQAAYSLRADLAAAQSALAAAWGAAADTVAPALQLSLTPCRALVSGSWAALWLGPDEQLLVGPRADGPTMVQRIESALGALPHSLVDVSHRQVAIELSGPGAGVILNSGCPLDLDLKAAPVGFCSRTVFGKSEIVLWRRGEQDFQVQVWRSFLPYVKCLLALAAEE
jgi:sarcosine oxidase, subunit gamma